MTTGQGSHSGLIEGAPVYGQNGDELGKIKEVRGQYFKVDAPMQADYWLRGDVVAAGGGGRVMLRVDKDQLGEYTVATPDDDMTTGGTETRRVENLKADTTPTRMTEQRPAGRDTGTGERSMELREEELRARKEQVQAGEVEIRKDVVEEKRTIDVPVSREEVVIERHTVDRRPASGSIDDSGQTIEVPLMEEHATLEKETVVTGEVEIGKRTVQETEKLSGTVRREEARIDREGDVTTRGDKDVDKMTDHDHKNDGGVTRR